jgi:hypothetical protein
MKERMKIKLRCDLASLIVKEEGGWMRWRMMMAEADESH